jgi:hypothetical protein
MNIKAFFALAGIAGGLAKFSGLFALIPGVGPVLGVIGAVFGFICEALALLLKSLKLYMAHPLTFVLVPVWIVIGVYLGIKADEQLVIAANAKVKEYSQTARNAIHAEKTLANAAIEQARLAKLEWENRSPSTLKCPPPVAPQRKPDGVRSYRAGEADRSFLSIPGLRGF